MDETYNFTDNEIIAIRKKVSRKYDIGLRRLFIFAIPLSLVMPYLPSSRSGKSMLDRMPYDEAVIQTFILYAVIIVIYAIWYPYKTKKDVSEKRHFLRKEEITSDVIKKSRSIFSNYRNIISIKLENEVQSIEVTKEKSDNISTGSRIVVEYEKQTKTILNIRKITP